MQSSDGRQGLGRVRSAARIGVTALGLIAATAQASSAQDADPTQGKAVFSQIGDSGVDGSASLTAKGDGTVVKIRTDGAMGDHPTHIHQGSCDDLDPNPEFPLRNVQLRTAGLTGSSNTTVDVPIAELLDGDHLILIHKSSEEIGTYLACGDIVAGRLSSTETVTAGVADPLPSTGTGIESVGSGTTMGRLLIAGLSALAVALSLHVRQARLAAAAARVLVRRD